MFHGGVGGDFGIVPASSSHAGGVVASLCDGSARFISDTIDIRIWRHASTRDSGESTSFSD
ncbi:H-X9-DG-CTERM domain-containing protein [Stieleria mannarensis]|uniref:H-X9-DG-CTERM domain-containing protein n=1 Tax=Stieleria mannarensis TaxID=2755585 RepID=UPI001600C403